MGHCLSSFARVRGDDRPSYLELLRLTAPEIVVALAGIAGAGARSQLPAPGTLAIRFRSAVLAACIGCVIALVVLERYLRKAACRPECWWSIR